MNFANFAAAKPKRKYIYWWWYHVAFWQVTAGEKEGSGFLNSDQIILPYPISEPAHLQEIREALMRRQSGVYVLLISWQLIKKYRVEERPQE